MRTNKKIFFNVLFLSIIYLASTSIIAYGQSLTRYNIECGVEVGTDKDILKGVMVIQFGGTNTLKWDDREAAELFNCIEAIEYQERHGIYKPIK
jgi:hypothetical protein